MKYLASLGMAWLLLLSNSANAALILTAVAETPSTVSAGTPVNLNVFLRSNTAGGESVNGIDFVVHAATTISGTGNGTAGTFSTGNTFLLGSSPFDVSSRAGQAFSTNFQTTAASVAFSDGVGVNLGTLYASLTLNTTGVAPGNYFFAIDQLVAINLSTGPITTTGIGTTFTIEPAVVPEPSSLAALSLAACGFVAWRKRRRKQPSR